MSLSSLGLSEDCRRSLTSLRLPAFCKSMSFTKFGEFSVTFSSSTLSGSNDLFISSHKSVVLCPFVCSIFLSVSQIEKLLLLDLQVLLRSSIVIFFFNSEFLLYSLYFLFGSSSFFFFFNIYFFWGNMLSIFYKCVYFTSCKLTLIIALKTLKPLTDTSNIWIICRLLSDDIRSFPLRLGHIFLLRCLSSNFGLHLGWYKCYTVRTL